MSIPLSEVSHASLRELCGPTGPLACRWCKRCDSHYRFCKCTSPEWMLRAAGQLGPMPNEPGGPRTLSMIGQPTPTTRPEDVK
jgi:hypothetical protein